MKTLTQKLFETVPDWLKVKLFQLDEEEERFLDAMSENRLKLLRYIREKWRRVRTNEEMQARLSELEQDYNAMKFLLNKYGENGRFYRYFSEQTEAFEWG